MQLVRLYIHVYACVEVNYRSEKIVHPHGE